MKFLIVIPAYNEALNIESVVNSLREACMDSDYVVLNDGTARICRENGYNLLDLTFNLGLSGAFQAGLRYAYENGYNATIQFDGDEQHDPQYIKPLIDEILLTDSDIVIGSRFKEKEKPRTLRMMGNRLIQLAIQITTREKLTVPTSGMRLFNRKMLERFAPNINYEPELDTIAFLLRCGAKISEIQVEIKARSAVASYLSFGRSILYMLNMCMSITFIQFFRRKEA